MELSARMTPEMGMRVSPRLIAASQVLEMSSAQLQQAVAAELAENPALEMTETPRCPLCGEELQDGMCPRCQLAPSAASYEAEEPTSEPSDEDEYDPLNQVAAELTLQEQLLEELQAMVPEEDHPIAEYLVGNLDDDGYLQSSVEEAADFLVVDAQRVSKVLAQLQSLEPAGIGARDLRESLLLQLDRLAQESIEHPRARSIVDLYLRELAEHRYSLIASQLGVPYQEVAGAVEFIRRHLNPVPAQGYGGIRAGRSAEAMPLPEVVIRRQDGQFEVEVVESRRFVLRVNPFYQQMLADLDRQPERYSEDEQEHIRHYVGRARFFLSNINLRRQTMQRIADQLVQEQREFLERGVHHLKPLTRAALAAKLGLHESTVSRATAAKYVQLPWGQVVPFSHFFTPSLGAREMIREVVAQEPRPLSDQEIAGLLRERGVQVARRTVAKYREQLGILPSPLRSPPSAER